MQVGSAILGPPVNKNNAGIVSFDNTEFSVDSNGYVTLIGGSSAIDSVTVDTFTAPGTNPVLPDINGNINVIGGQIAAGSTTNAIRTDSLAANTYKIEIQRSSAQAATTIGSNGVSHYKLADFAVDANGFVSLSTTGAGKTITGDTGGALSPTANNWNIIGGTVAAGTSPVKTAGSVSTLTINVQTSQALAAADATKIGLSNFDSSSFAVAATGFVTLSTTGALKTLTGNTGGAISPTANNINTVGTGSITIAGSGSTLTTQLTGLTANSVLYGLGTATIGLVASGTTGQVLQTNTGAAPTFSTATYPSTTTVSQILYSSSTNVVAGLATANSATLVTTNAGVPVFSGTMTNGQMIIGSTGATPVAGTITSTGGTVAVTVGAGTLNLEVATSGFTWTDTSGAFSALKENGYFITGTATGTLPASPSQGDTIKFFVDHASQVLTIQATAGKIIRLGSLVSSSGGTFVSTLQGDSVELTYRTSDTCWCAIAGFTGTWTLT